MRQVPSSPLSTAPAFPPVPSTEPENFFTPPKVAEGAPSTALSKNLTLDQIEELANTDPKAALEWLNLQTQLEAARQLQTKRTHDANFRMEMLRSTEQKIKREAQYRAQCEQRGHVREDGSPAIGGQRDSTNTFVGACCKCAKSWRGIGSGPGQLPPYFANRLNAEMIGG